MFMRGQMERNIPPGMTPAHAHKIEWRVDAVVKDDSAEFAKELEKILNDGTSNGYLLTHMLPRSTDNGLVVIHQRHLIETPTHEDLPGPAAHGGN